MITEIPGIVLAFFWGSYTDSKGRKPAMMMPLMGALLRTGCHLIVTANHYSINYLLIGAALDGLSGGPAVIMGSVFTYIADVTTEKQRSLRVTIVQSMVIVGLAVSQLGVGYMIDLVGYLYTFVGIAICQGLCLLYVMIWLKESITQKKKASFFTVQNAIATFKIFFKDNGVQRRWKLLVSLMECHAFCNKTPKHLCYFFENYNATMHVKMTKIKSKVVHALPTIPQMIIFSANYIVSIFDQFIYIDTYVYTYHILLSRIIHRLLYERTKINLFTFLLLDISTVGFKTWYFDIAHVWSIGLLDRYRVNLPRIHDWHRWNYRYHSLYPSATLLLLVCSGKLVWHCFITKFMGPTWGPPGSCRPQMGPMNLAIRVLLED